jgi:hypothetical protein
MSDLAVKVEAPKGASNAVDPTRKPTDKPVWVAPKLEDVSEQVMGQPYIRFT